MTYPGKVYTYNKFKQMECHTIRSSSLAFLICHLILQIGRRESSQIESAEIPRGRKAKRERCLHNNCIEFSLNIFYNSVGLKLLAYIVFIDLQHSKRRSSDSSSSSESSSSDKDESRKSRSSSKRPKRERKHKSRGRHSKPK